MFSFPNIPTVSKPGQNYAPYTGFADDFHGANIASGTADAATYHLATEGGSPSFKPLDDAAGGWFRLAQATTNYCDVQVNGEAFKLVAGKPLRFEASVADNDVDAVLFFLGLTTAGVTNAANTLPADGVGFKVGTDGKITFVCRKDSAGTAVESGKTFSADAEIHRLGFEWNGVDAVTFHVDGVPVGSFTTTIPDDEALTLHLGMDGSTDTVDIDYWICTQTR